MGDSSMLLNSRIEIIVPTDGELDLSSRPKERSSIFLDELVNVYILLYTTASESSLAEQLPRLSISLETLVTGSEIAQTPATHPQAQVKAVVDVHKIDTSQDPLTAITSDGITLAWTASVHIDRNRITSTSPSLSFAAIMTLNHPSAQAPEPVSSEDDYLQSGVPVSSPNLLAALAHSKPFAGHPNPPYLATSRSLKTAPSARPQTLQLRPRLPPPLQATSSRFELLPAITSHLRTVNLGRASNAAKMLASIGLDVSQHLSRASIDELEVVVEGGKADRCGVPEGRLNLPIGMNQGDSLSLIYDILPDQQRYHSNNMRTSDPANNIIALTVTATAFSNDEANLPRRIRTQCTTPLDLSFFHLKAASGHESLDSLLTLTTTRHPSTPAHSTPGTHVRWNLLIANQSTTRTLDLGIIPITPWADPSALSRPEADSEESKGQARGSKSRKLERNLARDPPTWLYASARFHPTYTATPSTTNTSTASDAPQDPFSSSTTPTTKPLRSTHPTLLPSPPLLYLDSLPPSTSTTAELSFFVLHARRGTTYGGVEAIRIVDLDSFEAEGRWRWVDVGGEGLPDVVVVVHDGAGSGIVKGNEGGEVDVGEDGEVRRAVEVE